ncbi:hypothetical protein A8C56_12715 [Niabella ginsenosidivorans]|uniref:Gluconate 2-dehydrogenase subunit 3 family protein n=1 Tax=Niabella ginsenosidivorans TaxID=1176587 RepID=A0A1A9I315_9BACT|nr:gluconate 2-dehydrogenase subunit 3 family protein [Niabella ginsenosidivorans]ANH81725.1 hypothetical protein A8C56_12715 [Niabella ginsenosidivorans]
MKRRDYLKSIFVLGGLSLTSVSVYKWFEISRHVDVKQIADKRPVIAELAEMIIPRTDTPGAKDAGVPDYIVNVMIHCASVKEKNRFLSGIREIEDYTSGKFGKDFLKCTPAEKSAALKYVAGHARFSYPIFNKINDKFLGMPFYPKLKGLVVEGFCLSEQGATKALAYDYIPGSYEACIPLQPHQKSWATK